MKSHFITDNLHNAHQRQHINLLSMFCHYYIKDKHELTNYRKRNISSLTVNKLLSTFNMSQLLRERQRPVFIMLITGDSSLYLEAPNAGFNFIIFNIIDNCLLYSLAWVSFLLMGFSNKFETVITINFSLCFIYFHVFQIVFDKKQRERSSFHLSTRYLL